MKLHYYFASLLINILCGVVQSEEEWSFLVLADWHGGEYFAINPEKGSHYQLHLNHFKYIKENFGGDMMILPGDSQTGHWFKDEFIQQLDPTLQENPEAAVLQAGDNCYGTMRKLFKESGYNRVLMTVGDHELGDNPWKATQTKTKVVQEFREVFAKHFNKNIKGDFLFNKPIGAVDSRPLGTRFEETSFAYQYKNVLFITMDAFETVGSGKKDFFVSSEGIGGEGVITCSVEGDHLRWFTEVLQAAQEESTIKHIIVQAHLPIVQPVQMVSTSGASFDYGEESPFWTTMIKYGVDIYFGGEVHANTATKASTSNLLQVVTRGNSVQNFLKVNVTDDRLHLTSFNEVGKEPKYNKNYVAHGEIIVDKLNSIISSSGVLKLLNRNKPLIHFDFEEVLLLETRQVLGLKHDNYKKSTVAKKISIRGVACEHALSNKGSFGQQYDGQLSNVQLKPGIIGQSSGEFDSSSVLGIFAAGPNGGNGHTISYALWFRTSQSSDMVLIHYSVSWYPFDPERSMFTLALEDGNPVIYTYHDTKLILDLKNNALNDNQWHHLAVTMPRSHCLLSDVQFFIDGERKVNSVVKPSYYDHHIVFVAGGRIGIGGFAYSDEDYDDKFNLSPYVGHMDDIYVFGRKLTKNRIRLLRTKKTFKIFSKRRCEKTSILKIVTGRKKTKRCKEECSELPACLGYEFRKTSTKGVPKCTLFDAQPQQKVGVRKNSRCALVV